MKAGELVITLESFVQSLKELGENKEVTIEGGYHYSSMLLRINEVEDKATILLRR